MAQEILSVLVGVLSAALPLVPALWFGSQGRPTEMGLAIVAGSLAAAFLNLGRFKSFRGAGFEAVMRDLEQAKKEAYATIDNLRKLGKPLIESTLQMLTCHNRIGGMDPSTRLRFRDDMVHLARELGIVEDPAIQQADEKFLRYQKWDRYWELTNHISRRLSNSNCSDLVEALRKMGDYESPNFPSPRAIEAALRDVRLDGEENALLEAYTRCSVTPSLSGKPAALSITNSAAIE